MFLILYMKNFHFKRVFIVFLKKVFYNHANALLRCIEKVEKEVHFGMEDL